jgi:hypothetical protein
MTDASVPTGCDPQPVACEPAPAADAAALAAKREAAGATAHADGGENVLAADDPQHHQQQQQVAGSYPAGYADHYSYYGAGYAPYGSAYAGYGPPGQCSRQACTAVGGWTSARAAWRVLACAGGFAAP